MADNQRNRYRRRRSKSADDSRLVSKFARRISYEMRTAASMLGFADNWKSSINKQGLNGFDELRRYIKQGNVFCQEVGAIMQERSELENTYAKALSKLSAKLTKASSGCLGSLASSWTLVATEMETEAELHKSLGQALHDDIYKTLKQIAEQQHKTRKPIEGTVDKSLKSFIDKRADETKCKKLSFNCGKEREKLCDQLHNAKAGRGKAMSEKEITKLDKKVRSLGDTIQKADKDYHNGAQTAEQYRQMWESSVYKCSAQLQSLEEERIYHMQDMLSKYSSHLSVLGPKMVQNCDRLGEAVISVNVNEDLQLAIEARGTGPNQPEQMLLDYFAEDDSNTMDKNRRRQSLQNYNIWLQQDIDREIKSREGVERLLDVYQNRPAFADSETQEETRQRLSHISATTHFLEACNWKVSAALNNIDNRQTPESMYSQYIERIKDKAGSMVSILRLPISMLTGGIIQQPDGSSMSLANPPSNGIDENFVQNLQRRRSTNSSISSISSVSSRISSSREQSLRLKRLSESSARKSVAPAPAPPTPSPPNYGEIYPRQAESVANGNAYYDDDDEFDTFDAQSPTVVGHCRAIYDYTAQHYDELTIKAGDILNIHNKQDDGWWQGEAAGHIGIFPATYVEELGAMV